MKYELHYGSGGHGGPYHSLDEAVETAIRLYQGQPNKYEAIYVLERTSEVVDLKKAVMVIKGHAETRWNTLAARFAKLSLVTGRDKSSSYVLNVVFDPDGEILVEMGCYDIADWPRHLDLGPFKDEYEALIRTELKVIEAEIAVREQQAEDQNDK